MLQRNLGPFVFSLIAALLALLPWILRAAG